jgi:hypothetical protein
MVTANGFGRTAVPHMQAPVRSWIDGAARAVLERNWREGVTPDGLTYAYARPDRVKYPAQFFWDSCLHALTWARLAPARGRAELRSLVAAQEPDGFIGHSIFWDAPIRATRRAFYNVLAPGDRMTRTIQPPLLALAWEEVARASPDEPGFAAEGVRPLAAQLDWLARERAGSDGLLRILQPDESGLDASPKFDALLGRRAHGMPGFVLLVWHNRRDRFQLAAVRRRRGFVVAEVLVNTAYALSLRSLARLGGGDAYARRAELVEAALVERLWDERLGRFVDRSEGGQATAVSTWSSLAPLALPALPAAIAARLLDEHLLDSRRYWRRFPVPSTAADEPAYRPSTRLLRYWRGPTWLAGSYILHRGLVAHGRLSEARELARRTETLVTGAGFREYYNPDTGRGMGARAFGMSALAALITAPTPASG